MADTEYDLIIIGGGPAGLSAAVYAGRADLNTLVVERAVLGGQLGNTKDIANYPGFPDGIDGPELAKRMKEQAERFGVTFRAAEITDIARRDDGGFCAFIGDECLEAKTVVVASGASPRKLGIPGETELAGRGVSYCGTCDGPFFRDRRVVVVGGGDSALKEGLHIAKFASHLTIVHRRDTFRAETIYQRQVRDHPGIDVRWNAVVTEIHGDKKVEAVTLKNTETEETSRFETDGVFVFIGSIPNTRLICKIVPSNCGGNIETDLDMMTAVPGLYAVGDVREHSYRQVATAVGEGATAAIAAEHHLGKGAYEENAPAAGE